MEKFVQNKVIAIVFIVIGVLMLLIHMMLFNVIGLAFIVLGIVFLILQKNPKGNIPPIINDKTKTPNNANMTDEEVEAMSQSLACTYKTYKNENIENYAGATIISFLFPLIGLIIYAVNIGKNDELAKSCSKWALIGLVVGTIVVAFIIFVINTI